MPTDFAAARDSGGRDTIPIYPPFPPSLLLSSLTFSVEIVTFTRRRFLGCKRRGGGRRSCRLDLASSSFPPLLILSTFAPPSFPSAQSSICFLTPSSSAPFTISSGGSFLASCSRSLNALVLSQPHSFENQLARRMALVIEDCGRGWFV